MAPAATEVVVLAKSTAVSVDPVRPGMTHDLSVFDHAMSRHFVRLVFYYRPAPGLTRDALKESLSAVLSHYPVMTGRLSRRGDGEGDDACEAAGGGVGRWFVKCNDAGVRTVDAVMQTTLADWLATASGEDEAKLCYWEPMASLAFLWSPFYIQVTEFADGAFAIGLSCTHMHADPSCAALFVNAWADVHRGAAMACPPFFHPPALVPRPRNPFTPLPEGHPWPPSSPLLAHKSTLAGGGAGAMSSATFLFPADAIARCLSGAAVSSPFAALAALFWIRIAELSAAAGGGKAEVTVALQMRKRMLAPLPTNFFGNAVHFARVTADLAGGWGCVAAEMERRVAAGEHEEDFWTAIEWLDGWQSERAAVSPDAAFQMYGPELTIVELDLLPVGDARFDDAGGKGPEHVSCHIGGADGEGTVVVMPLAAAAGGRAVVVTLPAELTAKICADDRILELGPEIRFSPKK